MTGSPDGQSPLRARLRIGSDSRQFISDATWSVAAQVTVTAFYVAQTLLVARYLSLELFGVYALLIAFPDAVQQLLDFRLREGMTKYLGEFYARGEGRRAFATIKLFWLVDVAAGGTALLLVIVTAPFVAGGLLESTPNAAGLMVLYGVGLFFASLDSASGTILRVMGRFRLSFWATLASSATRFLLLLGVVLADMGFTSLILAHVIAEAVQTMVVGGLTIVVLRWGLWEHRHAKLADLRDIRRAMLRFVLHTNLAATARVAGSRVDLLLVGALSGPASAGVYKVATQFGRAILIVSDSLFLAVYPTFAKWRGTGEDARIVELARRLTAGLLAIVLVGCALLWVTRNRLISLTVGPSFQEAADLFVLLTVALIPTVSLFWARPYLLAAGMARSDLRISAATITVQLALLVLLVPGMGPAGAVTAAAVVAPASVMAQLLTLRRAGLLGVV